MRCYFCGRKAAHDDLCKACYENVKRSRVAAAIAAWVKS